MKKANYFAIALFLTVAWSTNVQAAPYTIADGYVGGDDHGYGDVIGSSLFEIKGMDINLVGTQLDVKVYTNYAGYGDNKLFYRYTNDPGGIGYGDLFLSSSWDPHGAAPYSDDDNSNGTVWTYGFALDNRWSASGGQGVLYKLTSGDNDADALLSEDFLKAATFRDGQEIAVDLESRGVVDTGITGTWSVANYQYLLFSFDIAGTELLNGPEIAAHWGMTCGNDVIEGSIPVSVPEPATMILFGTGLVSLAGAMRRKKLNK